MTLARRRKMAENDRVLWKEKGLEHCGECPDMPCQKLRELFDDPEHGDSGARLRNLNNWKAGNYVYERLNNAAQEKAKKLIRDLPDSVCMRKELEKRDRGNRI